jgi:hypothetical protein
MGWFGHSKKRSAPRGDRRDALAAVPLLLPNVRLERHDGRALLLIDEAYPVRLLGRLGPRTRTRRVELDELGTAVVDLLDGRRSVDDVVRQFCARFRLNPREAELSVTAFLSSLHRRRAIGMRAGPAAAAGAAGAGGTGGGGGAAP